jgi:hypothetical protein
MGLELNCQCDNIGMYNLWRCHQRLMQLQFTCGIAAGQLSLHSTCSSGTTASSSASLMPMTCPCDGQRRQGVPGSRQDLFRWIGKC